jgi:hypothetical protein
MLVRRTGDATRAKILAAAGVDLRHVLGLQPE